LSVPSSFFPRAAYSQDAAAGEIGALHLDIGLDTTSRVTVPISIGGQGPFTFLVDTGSERSVIATELAEGLRLEKGPEVAVDVMSGRVRSGTVLLPRFEIEGRALAPKAAPMFPQRHIGAMGILGLDALKSQRVVLDFRNATMAMNAEPMVGPGWEGETVLVTARSRLGQLVLTNAGVGADDESISVVIDTGAQFSVGNETLRRFLLRSGGLGEVQQMDLISVTGDVTVADYSVVPRLRVGGMVITNLPIAFADVHPFRRFGLHRERSLLLGMDALARFDQIGLNFNRRTVRFFWSAQPRES
jgi:hypothetical protein